MATDPRVEVKLRLDASDALDKLEALQAEINRTSNDLLARMQRAETRLQWYSFAASVSLGACAFMFVMASMPFAFVLALVAAVAFNLRAVNPR